MERRAYQEHPPRFEYRLTPDGHRAVARAGGADALGRPLPRGRRADRPPCSCTTAAAASSTWPTCCWAVRRDLRAHRHPQPSRPGRTARRAAAAGREPAGTTVAAPSGLSSDLHDLLTADPAALAARAGAVRDAAHGRRITYSPKVFIPLTHAVPGQVRLLHLRPAAGPPGPTPYLDARRGAGHRPPGRRGRLPRGPVHPGRAPRAALPGGRPPGWPSTATPPPSTTWWPWPRWCSTRPGLLPHANAGALFARRAGRRCGRCRPRRG